MRKRGILIGAMGLIIILLVAGCGASSEPATATVPDGAKAGDLTPLTPCEYQPYGSQENYDAECGTLIVPENRAKADSRLIALPVMRVHATGESPAEPIFFLNGGPGESNMGPRPPALGLANHDFVMVGYRGVDGSVVLDCPEVERAMKRWGDDLFSPESRASLAGAWAQCAARLQAEGIDLDGYSIPEVVADLEAARAGLGYERVNLGSLSYGTRIAQIYAYLHPDRIHRSIMASVNPPGHFVYEPETIDAQLEYYAQLCAQDAECSARTPDLAETIRNVANNMPERWLFIPIDPGQVKVITFVQLFNRGTAALVFDAYIAAEQGDPSGLALMSLLYDLLPSNMVWGESAAKAFSADYDPSRDYVAEMNPPDSILGSPLSFVEWSSADSWPTQQLIPAELRRVQPSDVETLLVSGSIDFSTPAEFATDELLPYLTNGKQVVLSEMGHVDDLGRLQPAAFERLVTSFYDTGVADDSLFTYAPMDFHVSLGAPTIAKIMLGIVLLVIVAMVVVVWFIVRRVRRRKTRLAAN